MEEAPLTNHADPALHTSMKPMASDTSAVVRWSWNFYPDNKIEGTKMIVPLGCHISPLAGYASMLHRKPLQCHCGGFLNPYCEVDYRSHTWGCVFCLKRNPLEFFPGNDEHQTPVETLPESLISEYTTIHSDRVPLTVALVLDICIDDEKEFEGMKEFVLLTLSKLPPNSRVILITYGATVQVHELCSQNEYPSSLAFRGSSEMTTEQLKIFIPETNIYVGTLESVELTLTFLIDDLVADRWPIPKVSRPLRCTGAAISVAASFLELVSPKNGALILCYLSGVCTEGPGKVVDPSKEVMIRTHAAIRDLAPNAKYWSSSCDYYYKLMIRLIRNGYSLSVFSASLDQTGISEMKSCIQSSGGVVLQSDSWKRSPFRQSLNHFLARRYDQNLDMGLNVTLDIVTSPSWKVSGVIGLCIGTGKKSPSIADVEVGMGGTCQWTSSLLDSHTSWSVFFDSVGNSESQSRNTRSKVTSSKNSSIESKPLEFGKGRGIINALHKYKFVQFIAKYEIGNETRTRIITLAHPIASINQLSWLADSFDQEAAVILMARQAIYRTDTTPVPEILRWLDRAVVRLVNRFGTFSTNQPDTLTLPRSLVLFPVFMYHLRRSPYLQVFNSSPDETAVLRMMLLKASVDDAILLIQPTLFRYTMDAPPSPVPLDSAAIDSNSILLMDTFFEIVVHRGEAIAAWRKAGYADLPEYHHFSEFLKMPEQDAMKLAENRFPTPKVFFIDKNDPDARILYNRLNPSRNYRQSTIDSYGSQDELVYTDEASLMVFMEQLKKLAVQSMN